MNYPTMNHAEEPVNVKPISENDSIKTTLEDTQRALCETREILMKIITNIHNVPSPENDKPTANCMDEQAIINRNLSTVCRDLAAEITTMLFG